MQKPKLVELCSINGLWHVLFDYLDPYINKWVQKVVKTSYQSDACFQRKAKVQGRQIIKRFVNDLRSRFASEDGLNVKSNTCSVSSKCEKPMNLIRTRKNKIHFDFHYIDPQSGISKRVRKATGLVNNKTNRAIAQRQALELFHDLSQHQSTEQACTVAKDSLQSLVNLYFQKSNWIDLEKASQELYQKIIKVWIVPNFADVALNEVNLDIVNQFRNELKDHNISGKYKNTILSVLKHVIRVGFENGMIPFFDISTKAIKKFKETEPQINYLKPKDRLLFLDYVRENETFYYPVIAFTAYTGLRKGEVTGLRWMDVDLEEHMTFIQKSYTYIDKSLKSTKTSRPRRVYLPDNIVEMLRSHRPTNAKPTDFVFVGMNGKPFGVNRLTKVVARSSQRAGLKRITMHSLRHTVASILANNYNIVLASKALGHSDIKTTMKYYHTDEDILKNAMRNQDGQ